MSPPKERVVIELSDGEEVDSVISDQDFLENGGFNERSGSPNAQGEEDGPTPPNLIEIYQACLVEILDVFPDISHEYVQQLYNKDVEPTDPYERQNNTTAQRLIGKILDHGKYPKERDRVRELKRKREDQDNVQEEAAKWKPTDLREIPSEYARVSKAALNEAFEYVPAKFINEVFKEHGYYYGAFFAILEAERGYDIAVQPLFTRLKSRRVTNAEDSQSLMSHLQLDGFDFENLRREMVSAFHRRKREDAQRRVVEDAKRAEKAMELESIARGEVMECGCCCETVTITKMTHCNGEEPHFFCLDCARKNANNDIGNSQYKLCCMDTSSCKATFSREQRLRFLDKKTIEKLERLQQQEEIRLADLDNLSTCPFCDFAAICPPIEQDREFRCHNPQCQEISCRICKLKSHIPLTCEEHKKENGISERRVIEEARTEALIRTCNRCKVRILKEDGCNKVICTSCSAVLCDYCGKDITKAMYNHFDGEGARAPPGLITVPGGKCPLYDESNNRKDQQVDAAEKEAMAKVRSEHPEISEEDLKIKFAKVVEQSTSRSYGHHRLHQAWIQPPLLPPMQPAGEHVGRPILYGDVAQGPAAGAVVRPARLGAMDDGQQPQWMEAALDGGQRQQAVLQQQAAHQRYMHLQQRQQLVQQQIQAIRLAQERQAIAEGQGRGMLRNPWAIGAGDPMVPFGNDDAHPLALNPGVIQANEPFDRTNHHHEWGRPRLNRERREADAVHGQNNRPAAVAARLSMLNGGRPAQEAEEQANRGGAAEPQLQGPRRRNAVADFNPWINPQPASNNAWLQ